MGGGGGSPGSHWPVRVQSHSIFEFPPVKKLERVSNFVFTQWHPFGAVCGFPKVSTQAIAGHLCALLFRGYLIRGVGSFGDR